MRNTLDVIKERRSIRKFKPEQIKEEELQAIVESGLYAPSAINKQSWNFTVIQNQEILAELNEATKNVARNLDNEVLKRIGENEKYNCFYYAPTVILVSGKDEERYKSNGLFSSNSKYVNRRRVIKYRFLLGRTCELSIYGTTS